MTQEQLKELFEYHEDGLLVWKDDLWNKKCKGKVAGTMDQHRYRRIKIGRLQYCTHRLIYLWHHGNLPPVLDHINRIKYDNRIENLRPVTPSNNQHNRGPQIGTSKWKGVSWAKKNNKWRASIRINRDSIFIGYFICEADAAMAWNEIAVEVHGDFAVLNEHPTNLIK